MRLSNRLEILTILYAVFYVASAVTVISVLIWLASPVVKYVDEHGLEAAAERVWKGRKAAEKKE